MLCQGILLSCQVMVVWKWAKWLHRNMDWLASQQQVEAVIRHFFQDGTLPEDEKVARKLLRDHTHYTLLDGVLYQVM